ncbi:MAG: DUF4350 domain-containing protein [bacterium]
MFTSIMIAPLSFARLYGFMPSAPVRFLLLIAGTGGAMIAPTIKACLVRIKRRSFDIFLYILFPLLVALCSFLMISFSKGYRKSGRVLFDIGHGSTQSPQLDYNKELYKSAEFGHAKLVRLIARSHFQIDYCTAITREVLAEASILVLIMPSLPYEPSEIDAIKEFVAHGGGLLVIGDHTDINQVRSACNPVIKEFGIHMRFDTIWIYTNDRMNLEYKNHPALFDLEKVNFSVGASLDITHPAQAVIRTKYGIFSDQGDPDNKNHGYLGNSTLDKGEKTHDLCLVAESRYGRGRVYVMGDSSYFQNASLYQNWIYACRLFDWLNHAHKAPSGEKWALGILLLSVSIICAFALLYTSWPPFLLPLLLLSLMGALWSAEFSNILRFPLPHTPFSSILIDMAHHNEYPLYWINREKSDTNIDGVVNQIIREGFYPVIESSAPFTLEKLSEHKAVFIICPNTPFHINEIKALERFVEKGGGVLLVEGPRKWAQALPLWGQFGLFKDRYPLAAHMPVLSPLGLPIRLPYGNFKADFIPHPITYGISEINMVNPCEIRGGHPLAFIKNIPVINAKEIGRGRICAIGDDRFFANYMTEFEGNIMDTNKIHLLLNIISYLTHKGPSSLPSGSLLK